jgi:O-antigen ligase/tetratricopeptide (TPR) repeat protein
MLAIWICRAMEAVLLFLVGAAPWLFGSVHPLAELILSGGLCLLGLLWIFRIVAERHAVWNPCSITLALTVLCALTVVQLVPLPQSLLSVVSPGATKLRDELAPGNTETFPSAADIPREVPSTVSLAPWETRHVLVQMIAILFVFSLVRSNFSSPETIYRLAIVAVFNGVALSLIGLAQWVSSKPNVVFWMFPSEGNVFGPFICRNHFAYYINMSMGLGIGLLLRCRYFEADAAGTRKPLGSLTNMLQDPRLMWIGSALVVMAAGLCCSLSRGGLAAFGVGAAVCLGLHWRHAGRFAHWSSGVVFVVLGLAVTAWLGAGAVGRRVATIWETNVLVEEGRNAVWSRVLGLFPDFPWIGTGMGTFRFVEPLTRGPNDSKNFIFEHMHNDYLEVLVEGGILQLAVVLTLAFLIFRIGFQAFQRHQGTGLGSMVVGALFGLVAVAIHSTVDFGLHVPAVSLLAITIVACVGNLGEPQAVVPDTPPSNSLGWLAAFVQVSVLLVVGVFVLDYSWRSERAERYRLAAQATTPDQLDKKIAYLEAAIAYTPNDPLMQAAAGDAYRERQHRGHRQRERILGLGALGAVTATPSFASLGSACAAYLIPSITDDTVKSFEHYVQARNLCPCLVQPHLFMAAYADVCGRADPAETYMRRACLLDPSNSGTWYVAGKVALQQGRRDDAWKCWRQSLLCDGDHLEDIVAHSAPMLSAELLIERLLPRDPDVVYQALLFQEKTSELGTDEKLYLNRVLDLLGGTPERLRVRQWILKAHVEVRLDRNDAAIDSYQKALAIEPKQAEWRLELCELLWKARKLEALQDELRNLKRYTGSLDGRAEELAKAAVSGER